jgi:hypothetical protein
VLIEVLRDRIGKRPIGKGISPVDMIISMIQEVMKWGMKVELTR